MATYDSSSVLKAVTFAESANAGRFATNTDGHVLTRGIYVDAAQGAGDPSVTPVPLPGVFNMPTTRTFLYTDNKRLRLVNTDVDAAVLTTSSSEVATLQSDVITAQDTADACLPLAGGTVSGGLTIQSSAPVLSLVDTDDNSDFRIRLEDGHIRFQDTTNFNRDFIVANSSGDMNLGVSGRTTASMGNFVVNGNTVLGNASVGGNLSVSGTVTVGGNTVVTNQSTLSTFLEVYHTSALKTVGVSITPTGAWQDLFTSDYPSVTIPSAQVNDVVEVRGTVSEDHGTYANMSSVFQYVIREGSSSGTDIGSGDVSIVTGGDNQIENAYGHYFTRAVVRTAGSIFVGLRYKAATTGVRTVVACANGSNSSLHVRLRRPVTVALV